MQKLTEHLAGYFKPFFVLLISAFLVSCAGTGSRQFSVIQPLLDDQNSTVIAVLRDIGYQGSANLMQIGISGVNIANLGDQEMIAHRVEPGEQILEAKFTGLGATFAGEQSLIFEINEGEKKYFLVQMRAGAFRNTITLIEVTRAAFSSAR